MDNPVITIKDVAEKSGLSLASVHRALSGKSGVSEKTRLKVKQIADELGYNPNYFASNMKKKKIRIAAVMVSPDYVGKYYFSDIWRGCEQFLQENTEYDIDFIRLPFTDSDGPNEKLKYIWRQYKDELDGIIITPTNSINTNYNSVETNFYLERYIEENIPVVFVGNDVEGIDRLCCVCPKAENANRLVAEYICSILPDGSEIVITERKKDVPSQICNIKMFEKSLKEMKRSLKIYKVYQKDAPDARYGDALQSTYDEIVEVLKEHPDVKLMYSCNARGSMPMAKAIKDLDLTGKMKMVGNDIFAENVQYLNEGIINALIFKNPRQQGYAGMRTIFNKIMKNELPPSDTLFVATDLIMKSNLEFYL